MICKINNIEVGRVEPSKFVEGVDETIETMGDEPIVSTKEDAIALNALLAFIGGGYLSIR